MVIRDLRGTADGTRGAIVESFTEAVDVMPTILDWLERTPPRECAGASLMPIIRGERSPDWQREVHWEYDFRPYYADAGTPPPCGLTIDECSLCVIRDEKYKYVHFDALPPLFFDLEADPQQFVNRATDPAFTSRVLIPCHVRMPWADGDRTKISASPFRRSRAGDAPYGQSAGASAPNHSAKRLARRSAVRAYH